MFGHFHDINFIVHLHAIQYSLLKARPTFFKRFSENINKLNWEIALAGCCAPLFT